MICAVDQAQHAEHVIMTAASAKTIDDKKT
jgi:hypothetical protein